MHDHSSVIMQPSALVFFYDRFPVFVEAFCTFLQTLPDLLVFACCCRDAAADAAAASS
jgi:hypothetical protein